MKPGIRSMTPPTLSPGQADTEQLLAWGRAVLEQEIEGLKALENELDHHFTDAVRLIAEAKGRLITSGMGKSGHVARKMAATFASTGTPAFFVHPGEASHGDLGMIMPGDVALVLSNSGETAELHDLITYCTRFSIPMIGMVRRKSSALVDASRVALVLPETPEASPVKAPTTSTTMMLALGDALAVAVMQLKGFSTEDFGIFHPGGKLGKAFVRVQDLMHADDSLPKVKPAAPMSEVIVEISQKGFGCAVVVDGDLDGRGGHIEGIITDGDLRRHMGEQLIKAKAGDVMTKGPRTIRPQALATEALAIMNEKSITSLLVAEDGALKGLVHIHDLLRAGIA
ncbi:KpsF/GutQ family sugar-phosphate isomerase [bacterium]|nr:KpsF/GutQ family sugar-phosphate isomerase [bacterium]